MPFSGSLVQVARPSMENSLAEGVVGIAWWVGPLTASIDLYAMEPEAERILLRLQLSVGFQLWDTSSSSLGTVQVVRQAG